MSNFTDFIGGGGGSEINDIKPINSTDLLYTDAEGNKWGVGWNYLLLF